MTHAWKNHWFNPFLFILGFLKEWWSLNWNHLEGEFLIRNKDYWVPLRDNLNLWRSPLYTITSGNFCTHPRLKVTVLYLKKSNSELLGELMKFSCLNSTSSFQISK